MQRTLVIIKPDAVKRNLMGEIISRLERRNLYMQECKYIVAPVELSRRHYHQHVNQPYFERITTQLSSAKIMVMIWVGPNAVSIVRSVQGATDPTLAAPGTVRGDFACQVEENLMHAADSVAAAEQEIKIWFH